MKSETVLVLQGGGSLGAYECGVYKTLAKHGIKFDTIAGTSIGAVNASIISSMQRSGNNNNNNASRHFRTFLDNTCREYYTTNIVVIFAR